MLHLFHGLDFSTGLMLVLALLFVLFYEAINGFHDTANAVATVIYTRAMKAQLAVIMSGVCNFFGVLLGGLSVAYAIVHLLPTDLLLNISSTHGLAMMFSMLSAAIIWNLGTWYFGIPASSSHTLIGSIIGIGLTNAIVTHTSVITALNIPQMINIFLALLISPVVGLVLAGFTIFLLRRFWSGTKKRRRIHLTPLEREKKDGKRKPPFWTRTMLILSAVGVSFSHGANDGQKGIGLLMLALIGVAPAGFVMNLNATSYDLTRTRDAIHSIEAYYQQHPAILEQVLKLSHTPTTKSYSSGDTDFNCETLPPLETVEQSAKLVDNINNYGQLAPSQRIQMRRLLMCVADDTNTLMKQSTTSDDDQRLLNQLRKDILISVEYAPLWIIVAVAFALSIGTMIGWRRIAVTIGEKIGKKGMTYAQGVAAQATAALSIGVASYTGMPVSTTHVLSSAVAGAVITDGGGVQVRTIVNIIMAWVLTLPATVILSGLFYWTALQLI